LNRALRALSSSIFFAPAIITGFGDFGLPVIPYVVELGPLPDGQYTVTWYQYFAPPPSTQGRYVRSFTLVNGLLVETPTPVPALTTASVAILAMLICALSLAMTHGANAQSPRPQLGRTRRLARPAHRAPPRPRVTQWPGSA
jgi:hypothetical protein